MTRHQQTEQRLAEINNRIEEIRARIRTITIELQQQCPEFDTFLGVRGDYLTLLDEYFDLADEKDRLQNPITLTD